MSNCTSDDNCKASLVCYTSPQWTSAKNFCSCESWHGWVGEDCLGLGSGSVYVSHSYGFSPPCGLIVGNLCSRVMFLSSLLSAILAIITLVLALEQLKRTVFTRSKPKRKRVLLKQESKFEKYCFNTAAVMLGFL